MCTSCTKWLRGLPPWRGQNGRIFWVLLSLNNVLSQLICPPIRNKNRCWHRHWKLINIQVHITCNNTGTWHYNIMTGSCTDYCNVIYVLVTRELVWIWLTDVANQWYIIPRWKFRSLVFLTRYFNQLLHVKGEIILSTSTHCFLLCFALFVCFLFCFLIEHYIIPT